MVSALHNDAELRQRAWDAAADVVDPEIPVLTIADLGVLRGSNFQTTQRVYWSNKATAITADVPSEAELTPKLWGKWRIIAE